MKSGEKFITEKCSLKRPGETFNHGYVAHLAEHFVVDFSFNQNHDKLASDKQKTKKKTKTTTELCGGE